ncbi:MAG: hypothetical protein NVSMB70_15180 [Chamaesiphon sp.]
MAIVWHPDRFAHHPRLQQKAEYKFKQINEAHERLRCLKVATFSRASMPHTEPTRSPNTPSNTKDFDKSGVKKAWRGSDKKGFKENKQYTYQSNQKDIHMWLD